MKKSKITQQQDGIGHLLFIVVLAVFGIVGFIGYSLYKQNVSRADTNFLGISIFLAPSGSCSDEGTGTKERPVCSFKRAEFLVGKLRSQGKAQGNIYYRLNQGTYSADMLGYKLNAVAKKGYTFYLVPADYKSDQSITYQPSLTCNNVPRTARSYALSVDAKEEGAVKLIGLRIANCTNGIDIGGKLSFDCPPRGIVGKTLIIGAAGDPMNGLVLDRILFENIGNKYFVTAKNADNAGWFAIGLRNATNVIIANSTFRNIENIGDGGPLLHALYAKQSDNIKITGNTFSNISGDPIRFRHKNMNINIVGNTFTKSGEAAAASEWHHDESRAQRYNTCLEANGDKPIFTNNTLSERGYNGQLINRWSDFSD